MQSPVFTIQTPALPTAMLIAIAIAELVWLWSVVTIVRQRTPEPTDRIVWLIVVLFFNFLGTVAFMLFYPWETIAPKTDTKPTTAAPHKAQPTNSKQIPHANTDSDRSFF